MHRPALAQLQERDYAAKYRGRGEPIHLIGVEFSRQTRNVTSFEPVETSLEVIETSFEPVETLRGS